jgi:LEA14-like dessication related protein
MVSSKKNFIFLVLLFFIVSSCRNLKEVQCTGVKGFTVNKVNLQGIDADILLAVNNPNTVGFSIYRSSFDITFGGVYLGKAKLSKRVHIARKTEEVYRFNLKSDFKGANFMDIMKFVNGALSKGIVEVKGDLKVGKFLIRKKFPVNIKEKVGLN